MSLDEQRIKLAADLYDARTAARQIAGADYEERLKQPKAIILAASQKWDLDKFKTTMRLCEKASDDGASAFVTMWFLAAYVELVEAG